MRQYNDLKKIMDVAAGRRKASLVLKGGTIVNVFTERTEIGDIAIEDGCIAGIGEYDGLVNVDMTGRYICPGFIDGHIHIESSMVSPVFTSSGRSLQTIAGRPMLMALRKKILAKDFAMTACTPSAFKTPGACSLEEPQPKFSPPTTKSPGFTFFAKSGSNDSNVWLFISSKFGRSRYWDAMIWSVSRSL